MRRLAIAAVVLSSLPWTLGCSEENKENASRRPNVVEHAVSAAGETIVIEMENPVGEVEAPMEIAEAEGASGGKALVVEDGKGKPGEACEACVGGKRPDRFGAASYTFDIKTPGTYRIWGRAWWLDGCGNSVTLVVDGNMGNAVVLGEDGTTKHWHWVAAFDTFTLDAGTHKLEVLNREDGIKLDKLIVTSDLKLVPQEGE